MSIPREDCAAVIIDIQERLFPHIHQHDELESNVIRLIQGLQVLQVPIVITEQYSKGLGPTIESIGRILETNQPIEKITFSCCASIHFNDALESLGKYSIIIAGTESHVCVLQTVQDLMEQNYLPVVVEDCVSSRKVNDHRVAIERMRQAGAVITTYESLLFELLGEAGSDTFKAISKIVK
jgi:nicotinamidase-related amidase